MKTRKPISTISYNTESFLSYKLDELIKAKTISYWCYVYHLPEDDETKPHFHVLMYPNGQVDTMDIQRFFEEIDLDNLKPLGMIYFVNSNPDDWYLYCSHNSEYLASKCQSRKHCYNYDDFYSSDFNSFEFDWHHAFTESDFVINRLKMNKLLDPCVSPQELIKSGFINWTQSMQLKAFIDLKNGYGSTNRGFSSGHENNRFCENSFEKKQDN